MSIITGRYPHSHGALANSCALPADQQTIGHYFKSLGYQTAAIGKMHFIDEDQHHGFDYRVEKDDYAAKMGAAVSRTRDSAIGISPQTEEETYEHFLTDKMIDWLKDNGQRPFCAWCSMVAPHPPFIAPKTLYDMYAGKTQFPPQPPSPNSLVARQLQKWAHLAKEDAQQIMTAYLGRITLVDRNMGRVLAALEQLGLAENTIVSYTADHGDMQYEHKLFGKGVMYDGASRVPLMLRWPGHVPAKAVRHELVEHVDFYPTLCELAGVPVPGSVQGRSLVPLLQDRSVTWPNLVFSELGEMVMVRNERHKCVFYDGTPSELYDMTEDPREFTNLAGSPAGQTVLAEMTTARDEWMSRTQPDLRTQAERRTKVKRRQEKQGKKGRREGSDESLERRSSSFGRASYYPREQSSTSATRRRTACDGESSFPPWAV
jgi:choline-sulfatase